MDRSQDTQDTVIDVSAPHTTFAGRITAVAASPNLVYVGTAAGDIRVVGRVSGEYEDKRWDDERRSIEGIMFDFEGKMVYATEMNLVLVDRHFSKKLKEYRSYDPLRMSFLPSPFPRDWKEDEAEPRPHQSGLVGKQRLTDHSRSRESRGSRLPYDCGIKE